MKSEASEWEPCLGRAPLMSEKQIVCEVQFLDAMCAHDDQR